jgi:hypothetical protein
MAFTAAVSIKQSYKIRIDLTSPVDNFNNLVQYDESGLSRVSEVSHTSNPGPHL